MTSIRLINFLLSILQIDPVFYMVTATVNPMLMSTGDEYFWSDVFNEIQRSCRMPCQVSAYGITLTGRLSQVTRAGQILQHKWTNYNRGGTKVYQNFNEHDPHYTQSGTTAYQPGTPFANQPATPPPYQTGTTPYQTGTTSSQPGTIPPYQPDTPAYQPGTPFANQPGTPPPHQPGTPPPYQSGTTPYQPGTTHNQRGTTSNQPGTIVPYQPGTTACQPGTPFTNQPGTLPPYQPGTLPPYQSGTTPYQPGTTPNQPGGTPNQYGAIPLYQTSLTSNQHGMTNSITSANFAKFAQNIDPRFQNQFNQQAMNYSLQQRYQEPGVMEEGQWWNRTSPSQVHSDPKDPGNAHYEQRPHSEQYNGSYANQPQHPQRRPPGFEHDRTNQQQFGNQQNTHPQNITKPLNVSETNPHCVDSQGNQEKSHPRFKTPSPCEGGTNPNNGEPSRSFDSIQNSQPIESLENINSQNAAQFPTGGTPCNVQLQSVCSTKNFRTPGIKLPPCYKPNAPNCCSVIEGRQVAGTEVNLLMAETIPSIDSKTTQPLHDSTNTNSREHKTLTEDAMFTPNRAACQTMSQNGSTDPQPPVNDQQNNLDPSSRLANSTTSCNQFLPSTEDTTGSQSEMKPIFSLQTTANHPVATSTENQKSTTSSSSSESESSSTSSDQSSSTDTTDSQSEPPVTLPQSITGPEIEKTSSDPSGLPTKNKPDSESEKPSVKLETTVDSKREDDQQDDEQGKTSDIPNDKPNTTKSSKSVDAILNDQPDTSTEQSSERDTTLTPPNNGQEGSTPTTGTPDSAVSNDQTEKLHSLSEKPSHPTENIPNNQPQITNLENQNAGPSSNIPPASKPNVKPRKGGEQTGNLTDKIPKPTPVPRPRQNRSIGANFLSSTVKSTETKLENPAQTEPNKDGIKTATDGTNTATNEIKTATDKVKSATDEVRTATVKTATDEVKTATDEVKQATDKVKLATDGVHVATDEVKTATDEVKPATDKVKPATDEVKPATNEIKPATDGVKRVTGEVKTATDEVKQATDKVNTATNKVKSAIDEVKTATDEVEQATNKVNTATEEVKKATNEVKPVTDGVTVATDEVKAAIKSNEGNLARTKPDDNAKNDKVAAKPNEENEQNATTEKLSATTDKNKGDTLDDELD